MKYALFAICFSVFVCVFTSCKKADTLSNKQVAGLWVTYEIVNNEGVASTEIPSTQPVFGPYHSGARLSENGTFVAIAWNNANDFSTSPTTGTFICLLGNKLYFKGSWEFNADVIKFENDDLWLKMDPMQKGVIKTYKLKRHN